MSNLGTLTLNLVAKIGGFTGPLDKAERHSKKHSQNIAKHNRSVQESFNKTLSSIKGYVAGYLTISAATRAIAGTIRVGAAFEQQMKTVQGVMRASQEDYKKLTDSAKLMGATTEWSASQSAEALQYMGMAGWSVQNSIKALPDMLQLASAGGLELGRASDIVTDSLTAMGMGINDLKRFNDVLIGTITRSNTNVEMLGESLKYVAPIASQLGYDIEQTAAMLGVLANAGIKASDAGTDLRKAMIENVEASKKLGTQQNDLIGTLKAAKNAGWGVNEVVKNYGLLASKSVLVLMDQIDAYDKLENQLHNVSGETQALAEIKLDTFSGDVKILKSAIEGLGISLFELSEGPLREGVETLTEFVTGLNNIIKSEDKVSKAIKNIFKNVNNAAFKSVPILGGVVQLIDIIKSFDSNKNITESIGNTSFEQIGITKKEYEESIGKSGDGLSGQTERKPGSGLSGQTESQLEAYIKSLEKEISAIENSGKHIELIESGITQTVSDSYNDRIAESIGFVNRMKSNDYYSEENMDKRASKYKEKQAILKQLTEKADIAEINNKYEGIEKEIKLHEYKFEKLKELYEEGSDELIQIERIKAAELETINKDYWDDYLRSNEKNMKNIDLTEGGKDSWDEYLESIENKMQNIDEIMLDSVKSWAPMFGDFFASAILDCENLGDAAKRLASGMAKTMISAIGQMAAEWLIYKASKIGTDKATQAAAIPAIISNAESSALTAGINAYSSAAAIPYVGWAMAPAAMAAALAVTEPMAAAVSSLAVAGLAHEGIDSIPETGSWWLKKGERVTTAETSKKLDDTLNRIEYNKNSSFTNNSQTYNKPIEFHTHVNVTGNFIGNNAAMRDLSKEVNRHIQKELTRRGAII